MSSKIALALISCLDELARVDEQVRHEQAIAQTHRDGSVAEPADAQATCTELSTQVEEIVRELVAAVEELGNAERR